MGQKVRSLRPSTIRAFNDALADVEAAICNALKRHIDEGLPDAESKIWHAHPVWFLDENPIVGYNKLKDCVRLLFWSGQSFDSPGLRAEGSFKAAEARYTCPSQIDVDQLQAWLDSSRRIQWDYKNIVKRRGALLRLR